MRFQYMSQSAFLALMTEDHRDEYVTWPREREHARKGQFYLHNEMIGPVDAELLHSVVRHTQPARIVEVGSGWSTLIMRDAITMNDEKRPGFSSLITVDPGMSQGVKDLSGVIHLEKRAQDVEHDVYLSLEPGDFLFWDGSHVGGPGSDVEFLIDYVLQVIQPGVLVHVHDIFLPDAYPPSFEARGYDEQDYLAVFLNGHPDWDILFGAHWFGQHHGNELKEAFPSWDGARGAGSFYIMREVG